MSVQLLIDGVVIWFKYLLWIVNHKWNWTRIHKSVILFIGKSSSTQIVWTSSQLTNCTRNFNLVWACDCKYDYELQRGFASTSLYEFTVAYMSKRAVYNHIQACFDYYEGGSIIPCNHLFSLHMGAFIQRWQCLHQVWTFVFHAM